MLDASIFKAYDIRGVVDVTLTTEVVRAVGRVLGSMAREADVKAFCVCLLYTSDAADEL